MGILDFLSDTLSNIIDNAESKYGNGGGRSSRPSGSSYGSTSGSSYGSNSSSSSTGRTTQSTPRGRSALPPGRMAKTDVIKGRNSPLPTAAGAYRHVNKATGQVEYVGQTDNIRKRQQEHAREGRLNPDKQFVQYAKSRPDATKDELCRTEVKHIAAHKPSGNKTKGGNGRR